MSGTFYPYIGGFVWIGILLIAGNLLRTNIGFLQKKLIPSALIGGILGFILMNLGLIAMPTLNGWESINSKTFGVLVYHLFAFGFIGIGLMQRSETVGKNKSNWIRSGALWMALIYCLVYAVQGLTGKTVFELYSMLTSSDIFTGFGYLVGVGFAQNPGAGQAIGLIWENEYGVIGASSVGLAFGATGFLFAILIGIPLANMGIRQGWSADKELKGLPKSFLTGMMGKDNSEPCANATTHSANIDSLGFHFAIIFALYGLGYIFALTWSQFAWPESLSKLSGLGFALLYVWGMLFGMLAKQLLKKAKKIHILDNATVRRITGTTVDFMICAVFMGIGVSDIQAIFTPFLLTVIIASGLTFAVIIWFARRLSEFGFERGLATFGCYTGTVASGLLLLRIVDPEFKSHAAVDLAIMNAFILPIVQFIYISLPFVPSPDSLMLWVLLAYLVAMPLALFILGFVNKKRIW